MMGEAALTRTLLLYEQVLGDVMARVDPPVRAFHRAPGLTRESGAAFSGRSSVERGRGLAWLMSAIVGLPRAAEDCELTVVVTRAADGSERWARSFAGKPFVTHQSAGRGRWTGLMVERVWPMSFGYALVETAGTLRLDVRGWRAFGVPMPLVLGPRVVAFENGENGRFNFDVDIALPLLGRLVRYKGWLEPALQET